MPKRKIRLLDVNPHITCMLCKGYLVDATTITECLHTFCKSCIVQYLEENNDCPTCKQVIHQSHPLNYISHDRTMQDIVSNFRWQVAQFSMTVFIFTAELKKQQDFYKKRGLPFPGQPLDGEEDSNGKSTASSSKSKEDEDSDYHRSDEQVNICLECSSNRMRELRKKFIRCSSQATINHLRKFIAKKLELKEHSQVEILCNEEILGKDHTLKFVAVTRWRCKVRPVYCIYAPDQH
ncbi:polycomb group RING finger protein 3-like [Branchiostoma floridae]|uniref:Polycomb group RING finger protein 3 n=1 Tax=Branchiostoma floridae TaxID=7739 RepID=A0A9J7KZ46_BRAFL|nr:polycomb group RING finger protein 3-like [Branchiostoma floridae]